MKQKTNNIIKKMKDKIKKSINLNKNEKYNLKEVVVISLFSLGIGILMSLSIISIITKGNALKVDHNINKFIVAYDTIIDNYYGDIDKNKLIAGAITGLTATLGDPYTTYIDPTTSSYFKKTVEGTYEGIGCEIALNHNSEIIVVNIIPNTPAEKAGLQKDDIITKINNISFQDKNTTEVADYIQNNKEATMTLTIRKEEQEQTIIIKREKISIPSVSSEIITSDQHKIGYINIAIFSSITNQQFSEHLQQIEQEKIDGLIIDVRDNTGGYLDVVTDIASTLLPKGETIYQLEGKAQTIQYYDKTEEHRNYPVAILINGQSASASEILASAIKESYHNGYVVGTNSYGKGTAQQTITLEDGSLIKYTNQKWLTPNGNWINEKGVEPTNYIELSEEYQLDPQKEKDNQLNEAISLIKSKDLN